jgi:hypothetical protein
MLVPALREARRHVRSFGDEYDLLVDHGNPERCVDCEAFLQVGIDAFQWIVRADEAIRLGVSRGQLAPDAQFDRKLKALARAWLNTCDVVSRLNLWYLSRGKLGNLAEFRRCEAEMRAMVQSWQRDKMTDAMRALRDSAIEEHRRGETAEFI